MRCLLPALLACLIANASAVGIRVATFNIGAHFGTNYFDYGLGAAGTPDHDSVRAVLARIDADVVTLQEIHSADLDGSPSDLANLAGSLGYPHLHVAATTGAFDTTFRVVILSRFPFLSEGDIQSPPGARELSRLHPWVMVDVPGTTNDPVIVSAHLKSETGLAERFRRAVEMRRLVAHLADTGLTASDNFIVMGDFNPSGIDTTFTGLPAGLPGSYVPGGDITFPVQYSLDPLAYFSQPPALRLWPRQLDGSLSTYDTAAAGGPTLDLMLVSPAIAWRPVVSEIYNSVLDVSNHDGLAKAGAPLADGTSAIASDHYALFVDVNLDDAGPYVFTEPGQVVAEDFTGLLGNHDPSPWTSDGGVPWIGSDDGGSGVPGLRSYGSPPDGSLGFLGGGAGTSVSGGFVNQSPLPLTALQISLDVERWRTPVAGTADVISAELVTNAGTIPLTGLSFAANDPSPGGSVTRLEALASGLAIPSGAEFWLRFSFVPGAGGGLAPDDVFVNEFHYDNAGTDTGEFVEIAVSPGFGGVLSDVALVTYNGSNGSANGSHTLDTFIPGATTPSGHRLFHKMISGLQNDVEGFAVVAGASVLHFVSYEGSFTATDGPALGMTSEDIGIHQNGSDADGQSSLGLSGTGGNAADFGWAKFDGIAHSPGAPNSGQSFTTAALPSHGLAIDNLRVEFLTDHDLDGMPDLTDPDDDNDGQSDAFEVAFGADPLDAGSRFMPVLTNSGGLMLTFPGAEGIRYTVESSVDLRTWEEWSVHVGQGEQIDVPVTGGGPERFFRVRAGE